MEAKSFDRGSMRLAATLLLVGQLLYIAATHFHTGGEANNHHSVFVGYAGSEIWKVVHLAQFAAMAILFSGLFALYFVLDVTGAVARWAARFGAAWAAVALALYGVLQAVDGIALKQTVDAWAGAPDPEKSARFASAEAIRWLEWGVRSYQDLASGVALLLFAAATVASARVPRPVAFLITLSGVGCLAQGWLAGSEGFSHAHDIAIVATWALSLAWMVWLAAIAWLMKTSP